MQKPVKKYYPFEQIKIERRDWPNRIIDKAPIWCSVDLRDGNQALVTPMQLHEKLRMFKTLIDVGFKEIEVGFPSANDTEYEILRTLIERRMVPDDVWVQVLVQARPELIKRTFESVRGAKNVIIHFYNSTSTLQRKVVFKKDMAGVTEIAVEGAKLIKELTDKQLEADPGMNIRFEYSPESYTGTEPENAVAICQAVMEVLEPTPENPIILNLPATVEMCTPNTYADQIEYFIKHLEHRDCAIISLHPHNDRGTGVACAELGLLAGADRLEGTLFGNGERTGNLDLVTVALNMFTQGVDPKLDFHDIREVREVYEECTKMEVPPRQPYAGDLAFTAFSGSHQDAIKKGVDFMKETGSEYWEVPYLTINPADIGRQYEPIIRINSQSGKGGAAFVVEHTMGYRMPKAMHKEFGDVVKREADNFGDELNSRQIAELFEREYVNFKGRYELKEQHFSDFTWVDGSQHTRFEGRVGVDGKIVEIDGTGNGPIDAFFQAMRDVGVRGYQFIDYSEHAMTGGSNAKAICYIELQVPETLRERVGNAGHIFGVGINPSINTASILGVLNAINRSLKV